MHDLESLLKESRPEFPARSKHRAELEMTLKCALAKSERPPLAMLLLPFAAALLVLLGLSERHQITLLKDEVWGERMQPDGDLKAMAWTSPSPISGYHRESQLPTSLEALDYFGSKRIR
jgi:hypothetical protein